jgi:hypothetical protein
MTLYAVCSLQVQGASADQSGVSSGNPSAGGSSIWAPALAEQLADWRAMYRDCVTPAEFNRLSRKKASEGKRYVEQVVQQPELLGVLERMYADMETTAAGSGLTLLLLNRYLFMLTVIQEAQLAIACDPILERLGIFEPVAQFAKGNAWREKSILDKDFFQGFEGLESSRFHAIIKPAEVFVPKGGLSHLDIVQAAFEGDIPLHLIGIGLGEIKKPVHGGVLKTPLFFREHDRLHYVKRSSGYGFWEKEFLQPLYDLLPKDRAFTQEDNQILIALFWAMHEEPNIIVDNADMECALDVKTDSPPMKEWQILQNLLSKTAESMISSIKGPFPSETSAEGLPESHGTAIFPSAGWQEALGRMMALRGISDERGLGRSYWDWVISLRDLVPTIGELLQDMEPGKIGEIRDITLGTIDILSGPEYRAQQPTFEEAKKFLADRLGNGDSTVGETCWLDLGGRFFSWAQQLQPQGLSLEDHVRFFLRDHLYELDTLTGIAKIQRTFYPGIFADTERAIQTLFEKVRARIPVPST